MMFNTCHLKKSFVFKWEIYFIYLAEKEFKFI